MTKILQIILISCCFSINAFAQTPPNIETLLDKVNKRLTDHQSISYTMNFISKPYWGGAEDTIFMKNAEVHIIKVPEDTLLGGYYWVKKENEAEKLPNGELFHKAGFEYIYDLEKIYSGFDRYITIENAIQRGSIPQTAYVNFLFLRPKFIQRIKKEALKKEIVSSQCNATPCWYIKIKMPDGEKTHQKQWEFWIDKTTFDVRRMINTFEYKNFKGVGHSEWNLDNIEFDQVTKEAIIDRKNFFEVKNQNLMHQRIIQSGSLLSVGTFAPLFEGFSVSENRTVNFSEYLGSPTLLCFWSPVGQKTDEVLALLNELNSHFVEKNLMVIGLVKEHQYCTSDVVRDEAEAQNLTFPNLMVERDVCVMYGAAGFPEIYLIDESGKIVNVYVGYLDLYKDMIKKEINKILEK